MSAELMAVVGGITVGTMFILPLGMGGTSGTTEHGQAFTWKKWREEAKLTLWTLSPIEICRDVWLGYDDLSDAAIRLFGATIWTAAVAVSVALTGWGIMSWLQ